MKRSTTIFLITTIILIATGCASSKKSFDVENLSDLRQLTRNDVAATRAHGGKIRIEALKEMAMSLGAQGALAWRAKQINQMLESKSKELTRVFNFNGLMLDNYVVPPVLEKADKSLSLDSPLVIRLSDNVYRIVKQAHFVTTPPSWREYLLMSYKKPEIPDSSLLPRSNERQLWIEYINLGWKNGIRQANNIYKHNLATIQRDYEGMILYRELLAKRMVSKPMVAKAEMGITSNEDNTKMSIDDKVLRITSVPKLNPKSQEWEPVVITEGED